MSTIHIALAARAPIVSAAADDAAADADADAHVAAQTEPHKRSRTNGAAQTEPHTYASGITHIRGQLDAVMAASPTAAVERLLDAVIDGEIDGASWRGHTRCPLGWLEVAPSGPGSLPGDDTYLVEGFAFPVMPGQTPETNGRLRRLERWIALFLARRYDAERETEEAADAASMEASA